MEKEERKGVAGEKTKTKTKKNNNNRKNKHKKKTIPIVMSKYTIHPNYKLQPSQELSTKALRNLVPRPGWLFERGLGMGLVSSASCMSWKITRLS